MRKTHCARVLYALRDGEWHNAEELYRIGVIAHSRISELRKRGYIIEHKTLNDSTSAGVRNNFYRLTYSPSVEVKG